MSFISSFLSPFGLASKKRHHQRNTSSVSSTWSHVSSEVIDNALRLRAWDEGLVTQSLSANKLWPRALSEDAKRDALGWIVPKTAPENRLKEGTFNGTARALTMVFDRIESRFQSYFDVTNIQPSIPQGITDMEMKRKLFQWSPGPESGPDYDSYPPHLNLIPKGSADDVTQNQIFDRMRLLDTGFILATIVPEKIKDFVYGHPDQGATIAHIEERNRTLRILKKNIYADPNIGDRDDWFTDEVFAQQSFTGNNPTTIELANTWIEKFQGIANQQRNSRMARLLASADKASLYVQDCSHMREAFGASPDADLWVKGKIEGEDRFACVAVTLYRLEPHGKLHPLAICIDFKESLEKSVVIFNKRLQSSDKGDQRTDWPWRYAKTCAQACDWVQHEVKIHLNDCHLIEEATIVAANRTIPEDHLVFRLLHPHWHKTLAVNAGARSTLVPHIITQIIGVTPEQVYSYTRDSYQNFDWEGHYVPKDLERRGFPIAQLNDKKFHNYAYARDIYLMWIVLRNYVSGFLANGGDGFTTDESVANDKHIRAWCEEMRSENGGQLKSFPEIKTLEQLVDAVTLCVHIASPQHTAVNYLQEYYQSFVINKPPSLSSRPPATLQELDKYAEKDLMAALPINRPTEWLLASHVPYLLSFRVADDQNLVTYAVSQYHLAHQSGEEGIRDASKKLVMDLRELGDAKDEKGVRIKGIFSRISDELDDQFVEYKVMEPVSTAVSILI